MEPRLVATEKEVDEMIVRIDADKASAADTKVRDASHCIAATPSRPSWFVDQ